MLSKGILAFRQFKPSTAHSEEDQITTVIVWIDSEATITQTET